MTDYGLLVMCQQMGVGESYEPVAQRQRGTLNGAAASPPPSIRLLAAATARARK